MAVTYKNWRVKFGDGIVIRHNCQSLASPKFSSIHTVLYAHTYVNIGTTCVEPQRDIVWETF